jgi:hypothetical protein
MAATLSIPVYLSIGSGSAMEIGQIKLSAEPDGRVTMTILDIAAALRETAASMEAAATEEVDGAAP